MDGAITQWDGNILLYIQDHFRAGWLDPIMKGASISGEKGILWIALCIILMIIKKTRRIGIIASLSLALSFIVNNLIIKNLVERVRPYEVISGLERIVGPESDASFPSGHAACAFAVCIAIFLAARKVWPLWVRILLIGYAVLISFSRLYVGVHYPTDVLGGIVIASICTVVVYLVFVHVEKKRAIRKQEKDDADALSV